LLIVNPPKNVIKGDGPTVFLSAIGTPSSWHILVNDSIKIWQLFVNGSAGL
jgi:hypothetical protein